MFKVDEHEQRINELTQLLKVEGVDQAKLSTILQGLRENYTEVNTTIEDSSKKIQSFAELNEGLRSANMNLLSKLGTSVDSMFKKEPEKKEPEKKDDVIPLDDIAKEFLK